MTGDRKRLPGRDQDVEWASLSATISAKVKQVMDPLEGLEATLLKMRMLIFDIKVFANATIVLEDISIFHQLGNLTIPGRTKLYSPYDGSVLSTVLVEM